MRAIAAMIPGAEEGAILDFLTAEGVRMGASILDIPCGTGRRALALTQGGYTVTAAGTSRAGIEAVRSRMPSPLAARVRFAVLKQGNVSDLASDASFDAVLLMEHSLGRSPAKANIDFLSRLRNRIAPSGFLVVELLHRDFFASRPRSFSYHVVGTLEQHEFREFDPLEGILRLRWSFFERSGDDLRHRQDATARMRLPPPEEVKGILTAAGLVVDGVYGGWERKPLTSNHRKLILVARLK